MNGLELNVEWVFESWGSHHRPWGSVPSQLSCVCRSVISWRLCRLHCPCLPKELSGWSTILWCQQQLSVLTHACVCRLNAGALFILWVQIGQEPGDLKVHRVIHATLQGLIATDVTGSRSGAIIVSVSTAGRVSKCCWWRHDKRCCLSVWCVWNSL